MEIGIEIEIEVKIEIKIGRVLFYNNRLYLFYFMFPILDQLHSTDYTKVTILARLY